MFDHTLYNNKPSPTDTAAIQHRLSETEISLDDLATKLSSGATFKPALLRGTKSSDWISQQIFALDFDGGTTIQEELDRCKQLNILPCFGYTSFSHTPEKHKFRLVFCSDQVIRNSETRDNFQKLLIGIFDKSDKVTFDRARLFYGGRMLIHRELDNQINVDSILFEYADLLNRLNQSTNLNNLTNTTPPNNKAKQTNLTKPPNPNKPTNLNKSNKLTISPYTTNNKLAAIKSLDVDLLRKLLYEDDLGSSVSAEQRIPPYDKEIFSYHMGQTDFPALIAFSDTEVYDLIKQIDFHHFTGLDKGNFCCVLPGHEDKTPSANIFKMKSGTQVYKCFGCNRSFALTSFVERVSGCRRSEAIEFIKAVYGIELVQSDWAKQQKHLMIDSANYLDTEDFIINDPESAKLIRTRKLHVQKMLVHFSQYVSDERVIDGKPYFFASANKLAEICGISKNNIYSMSQTLTLFLLLGMINKLDTVDIPKKDLDKAKSIAFQYDHKKLTNFFSFEEYGVNLLYDSEEIALKLKQNDMTLEGLSREYILRTFGADTADKVFPQYKNENSKGVSLASDMRTAKIAQEVLDTIDKQGCQWQF